MSKTTLDYIKEIDKLESKCIREMEWKREWMDKAAELEAQLAQAEAEKRVLADQIGLACNRCPHSTDNGCAVKEALLEEDDLVNACRNQVLKWATEQAEGK